MLTKKDLKQIGVVFDQRLDAKLDAKLDEKLKPIRKELKGMRKDLKSVKKTLDIHILQTDRHLNYHHRSLVQLEEKTGVRPPSFLPT